MLVGKAGININDFYELEPREASLLLRAYFEKEEEKWMHTRELIATIINVNATKKRDQVKGKDIIKLYFEKEEKKISKTPEELYKITLELLKKQ